MKVSLFSTSLAWSALSGFATFASAASVRKNTAAEEPPFKDIKLGVSKALDDLMKLSKEDLAKLQEHSAARRLQFDSARECNSQLTITSQAELVGLATFYVSISGLPPTSAEFTQAVAALTSGLQHDIAVAKVCLSCDDINDADFDDDVLSDRGDFGFQTYCGVRSFGHDAPHSALVMAPIDPSTGSIFQGKLQGFVSMHGTEVEVNTIPSEDWPLSVGAVLADPAQNFADTANLFINTFAGAFSASAGHVSVLPDYIGYGESTAFDRSYVAPSPYMQAAVVSYVAAKRYIERVSTGCSQLVNTATLTGYSEGSYAAIVAAKAFEELDISVVNVHAGGTSFDLGVNLQFSFDQLLLGNITPAGILISSFLAYSFSNDFPFLANTGTGAELVSLEFSPEGGTMEQNVIDWWSAPNPLSLFGIWSRLPGNPLDLFNDLAVNMLTGSNLAGLKNPCVDGAAAGLVDPAIQPLCDAFNANSLLPLLSTAKFPITVCHSPTDELVGFSGVPDLTTLNNPNVQMYQAPLPVLTPQGTHNEANILCQLAPVLDVFKNLPTLPLPLTSSVSSSDDTCQPAADSEESDE